MSLDEASSMLTRRIIPCLDVRDGKVVKGVKFRNHRIVGEILELAMFYRDQGADELVLYDISASPERRQVDTGWVSSIAELIDIPFCVAGGIRDVESARAILNAGADKISVNTPAIENPDLVASLSAAFGQQCVVVGVDSVWMDDDWWVCSYTGSEKTITRTEYRMLDWLPRMESLGAGEIVLNCIDSDGVRTGYDVRQLAAARQVTSLPLVASGGAGEKTDFSTVFKQADVDAALAASIFHSGYLLIDDLKRHLAEENIRVRQ